jgi:hypothetical protein
MDRRFLVAMMRDAETLDEMSEAIYEARIWLRDHPDDDEIADDMASLFVAERSALHVA